MTQAASVEVTPLPAGEALHPASRRDSRLWVFIAAVVVGALFGFVDATLARSVGAGALVGLLTAVIFAVVNDRLAVQAQNNAVLWDGKRLTIKEYPREWTVAPAEGLKARSVMVGVTVFVWILDGSGTPVARMSMNVWPLEEIMRVLATLGIDPAAAASWERSSLRDLRNENRLYAPGIFDNAPEVRAILIGAAIVVIVVALVAAWKLS